MVIITIMIMIMVVIMIMVMIICIYADADADADTDAVSDADARHFCFQGTNMGTKPNEKVLYIYISCTSVASGVRRFVVGPLPRALVTSLTSIPKAFLLYPLSG